MKVVWNISPEETWSGRKPTKKHLHIFGGTTYMHIPKEGAKYVLLDYDEHSKKSQLWDFEDKKLVEKQCHI